MMWMEKNKKIIIGILIAIIIILAAGIAFTAYNFQIQYQTIAISNATTMEVPFSDNSKFFNDDLGIKYYLDAEHDVQEISWNSQEELSLAGGISVAAMFEKMKSTNISTMEDGVVFYENKELDCFVIVTGNDTTHDNILIMAKDKNIALHMYKSIKYGVSNISKSSLLQPSAPPADDKNNTDDMVYPLFGMDSYDYYENDHDYDFDGLEDHDDYDYDGGGYEEDDYGEYDPPDFE